MQKSNCRDSIHKRHGSDWLQDALYILSTKKSTNKNTSSVIRWRHADARHSLRWLSTIQLTVISFHMAHTLSGWCVPIRVFVRFVLLAVHSACDVSLWCAHIMSNVEQMFVFTNAFRQDYCTIPFPFVTPYYSDRYRDQCFYCFLISPDGKIVPADYTDRMMFGHGGVCR